MSREVHTSSQMKNSDSAHYSLSDWIKELSCYDEDEAVAKCSKQDDQQHNQQQKMAHRYNSTQQHTAVVNSLHRRFFSTQDARYNLSNYDDSSVQEDVQEIGQPKYCVRDLIFFQRYNTFILHRNFYTDGEVLAWLNGYEQDLKVGDRGNLGLGGFFGPCQITHINTGYSGETEYVFKRLFNGKITSKSWTTTVTKLDTEENKSTATVADTNINSLGNMDTEAMRKNIMQEPHSSTTTQTISEEHGAPATLLTFETAHVKSNWQWHKLNARKGRLTFACTACNKPAFRSSDVYRGDSHANHYVVVGSAWQKSGTIWPYPFYEACHTTLFEMVWRITYKICCACCGRRWGIVARNKLGVMLPFIKINSFALYDEHGIRTLWDTWKTVPWEFPVLSMEILADYFVNMQVHVNDYISCYDGGSSFTSHEKTYIFRDITIHVQQGTIEEGENIRFSIDTTAHASHLTSMLAIRGLKERLVSTGVQFCYPDYDKPTTPLLKKKVSLKMKHMAKNMDNIIVRVARSRECSLFHDIEKYNGTSKQQAYYTCDDEHVTVYTNKLNYFICTESSIINRNRELNSVDMMVMVFATDMDSKREAEVYVAAYNKATIQLKHVENFKSTMCHEGYILKLEKHISMLDVSIDDDIIEVNCVKSDHLSTQGYQDVQPQWHCCTTPVSDAFYIHEAVETCCMIEAPQQIAYYRVTTASTSQPKLVMELEVSLKKRNTRRGALLQTLHINIPENNAFNAETSDGRSDINI